MLAGVAQWLGQRVSSLILGQGHVPGLQVPFLALFGSRSGEKRLMFFSLPPLSKQNQWKKYPGVRTNKRKGKKRKHPGAPNLRGLLPALTLGRQHKATVSRAWQELWEKPPCRGCGLQQRDSAIATPRSQYPNLPLSRPPSPAVLPIGCR